MLRKSGSRYSKPKKGSAAIDCVGASGSKIDVILLDLTLPGPSSHAIVSRAEQVQPGSKVILTSAHSEEKARAIIGVPQIHGFIRKPFQYADLLQMLGVFWPRKPAVIWRRASNALRQEILPRMPNLLPFVGLQHV